MSLKQCIQRGVKGWNSRVMGAALAVMLGVACGGSETPEQDGNALQEASAPDDTGEVRAAICSYGYWRCPTTNEVFEYESLACSHDYQFSKQRMQTVCNANCPTTCKDSGWMTQ